MNNDISALGELYSIGISHWNAPVSVREQFSLSDEQRGQFMDAAAEAGFTSVIAVSTCNRSEILAFTNHPETLRDLFVEHSEGTSEAFADYGFIRNGRDAANHFFRVAVGLDAQILGDLQIIKQVKEAYDYAHQKKMVGRIMHRLLRSVFRAHKRSRHETDLATGSATIAYAAVQQARNHLHTLEDKNIILVGAGKIGKVTCKNLISYGARNVTLVNRTPERVEQLGTRFDLPTAGFDRLQALISKADVVIVATGADSPIITSGVVPDNLNGKRRIMLDLSVPRNVDPELDNHPGVEVINMDMLRDTTDEAYRRREENVPKVEGIIYEEIDSFRKWLDEQTVVPTIKALKARLEDIRCAELERYRNRNSPDDMAQVDELTNRITKKILAHSIQHLKENPEKAEQISRVIEDMFKLEMQEYGE